MSKKECGCGVIPTKPPILYRKRRPLDGENLPILKNIMKQIDGQRISAEDFLTLISPHTGDKGAALSKLFTTDLELFRKLCNEAYDTMTKDTNEVMGKTQIELGQLYAEKAEILTDKMVHCVKTIHEYIPDFNLEEYSNDPDKYLRSKFVIYELPEEEEIEFARRQLAYHRLNWLTSEANRLNTENERLQAHLIELKKLRVEDTEKHLVKEQECEAIRINLCKQRCELQNDLENLIDQFHEAIVKEEERLTDVKNDEALKSIGPKLIIPKGLVEKDVNWNIKTAQDIELSNIKAATCTAANLSVSSVKNPIKSFPDCYSHCLNKPKPCAKTCIGKNSSKKDMFSL